MRKPKIDCFRYKGHNDVYVSNVPFSTDALLSLLDAFPDKKIIALIESDADYVQTLSSKGKSIGIAAIMHCPHASRFTVACNKTELHSLLSQANIDYLEGLFIASMTEDIISDEFIYSVEHTASSMVKDGISDISISINFLENEMVISLIKGKYAVLSFKDKICSIFGD